MVGTYELHGVDAEHRSVLQLQKLMYFSDCVTVNRIYKLEVTFSSYNRRRNDNDFTVLILHFDCDHCAYISLTNVHTANSRLSRVVVGGRSLIIQNHG